MLLTAEESLAQTIVPRLIAAGGNPANVAVLHHIPGESPRLPSLPLDIPYIQEIITRHKIRLVIIDVLSAFLGGESKVNSHQDTEVRRALYPLFVMAEKTGCAVIALRHLNKQGDVKNAMYRGGGSIGITGQARAVYLVAVNPDDPSGRRRVLCCVKLNVAESPARSATRWRVMRSATWRS
jgi:RecA-family ATPase